MNNNQVFSDLLGREIVQIRFRPTLLWVELKSSIASVLEDKYEEWKFDNNGNIVLFSPKSKRALEIFTDHITFVTEKDLSSEDGIKHIESIFSKIVESCNINQIRRLGCRRTCVINSELKFSELTDLIYKRLFKASKDVLKLQGDRVSDLAYILDTEEKEYKSHVQIAAISKEQGLKAFTSKFELDKEPESDNNLFIDIDVSITDKISGSNAIQLLKGIIAKNHKTIDNYFEYLTS